MREFKRSRATDNSHAISALLTKRMDMMDEIAMLRESLAVMSNDIEALDRVLESLGYDGDVKLTPRVPRIVLFYRNELRHFLARTLKEDGPQTSRQMAGRLVQMEAKDTRDRRMMNDIVKRIGRALRQMRDHGVVARTPEKIRGEFIWQYVPLAAGELPTMHRLGRS